MNSEFGIRNSEFSATHPETVGGRVAIQNSKFKIQNSGMEVR
jgi:hypothetical protein